MLHDDKLIMIAEPVFRSKIMEGAFNHSKGIILGSVTNTNMNIRRFAQNVLKEIAVGPSWVDGLAYFVLSTNVALTPAQAAALTQTQVNAEVVTVFPHYAKAVYGDVT